MLKFKAEFHCIPDYHNCYGEFKTLGAAKLYVNKTMLKLMPYCREIRATINGYSEYECYELSLNGNLKFDSEEKALASADVLLCTMEKILGYKLDDDFYKKIFSISKRSEKIKAQPINYFYKTDGNPFGD